jgi:hypothetical protein
MTTSPPSAFDTRSLNEARIDALLQQAGIESQPQVPVPVERWPWQTPRSRTAPKADFFLPASGIYVEVKGVLTLLALAKIAWLAAQRFPFYLLQADDETWEPFADSPCPLAAVDRSSMAGLKRSSLAQQIEELRYFTANPSLARECNALTRRRVERHVAGRIALYETWTGRFP